MIKESLPTIEKPEEQQIAELKKELFDRECPKEYEPLIAGAKLITMQTPYAENLYREFKTAKWRELVEGKMKNEIVIDLGCGSSGFGSFIAQEAKARLYIGVDLDPGSGTAYEGGHEPKGGRSDPNEISEIDSQENTIIENGSIKIPVIDFKLSIVGSVNKEIEVTDDMLHAISQLKNNSIGAVIVAGIESDADSDDNITHKYLTSLATEIKRVLKLGGILIRLNSDVSAEGMKQIVETRRSGVNIFEK